MGWYLLKLAVMLPLLALAIWGCLALARKMQARMGGGGDSVRAVKLVETTLLAPGIRLAVVEFRGKEILVGSTKQGLTRLAEAEQVQ
ncbi:MAG: flagellar biosynthetic protein FliO [Alteripontixanthobacter sp.]